MVASAITHASSTVLIALLSESTQVSDDVKHAMCIELQRVKKVKFILRKQSWKDEMREYKANLRQTLLFRMEVAEILEGTDSMHLANNLESLAGNNKGVSCKFRAEPLVHCSYVHLGGNVFDDVCFAHSAVNR